MFTVVTIRSKHWNLLLNAEVSFMLPPLRPRETEMERQVDYNLASDINFSNALFVVWLDAWALPCQTRQDTITSPQSCKVRMPGKCYVQCHARIKQFFWRGPIENHRICSHTRGLSMPRITLNNKQRLERQLSGDELRADLIFKISWNAQNPRLVPISLIWQRFSCIFYETMALSLTWWKVSTLQMVIGAAIQASSLTDDRVCVRRRLQSSSRVVYSFLRNILCGKCVIN